ncbi:hypothetical protein [Gillisia limnaea]|nr:hypothetical protein [Gillisia limnaea]
MTKKGGGLAQDDKKVNGPFRITKTQRHFILNAVNNKKGGMSLGPL